jgi:hypothetical protein
VCQLLRVSVFDAILFSNGMGSTSSFSYATSNGMGEVDRGIRGMISRNREMRRDRTLSMEYSA